jgi:hypothetical protein
MTSGSSGSDSNTIEHAGSMMSSRNTMCTGSRRAASPEAPPRPSDPRSGRVPPARTPSPCAGCRRSDARDERLGRSR